MRLCLTCLFILSANLALIGCSTPQVLPKKTKVETKVDSNADGILVSKFLLVPTSEDPLSGLTNFGTFLESQLKIENLQTEGIEVRRVSAVDIPAILATIGIVTHQENVWHGQIFRWRDVHQNKIPYQGMLVAKSGIPYFIDSGFLSLLARSWLVQREDGLFVYVQLLPSWHVPSHQSVIVGHSKQLTQSQIFPELGLEFLLQDGEAIILAVHLKQAQQSEGPQDFGAPPVRLGEAMFGTSAEKDMVILLALEPNILPRE